MIFERTGNTFIRDIIVFITSNIQDWPNKLYQLNNKLKMLHFETVLIPACL